MGNIARATASGNVNVRAQPSTSGGRVGVIESGQIISVVNGPECVEGYTWWQIDTGQFTGWAVEAIETQRVLLPIVPHLPPLQLLTIETVGVLTPLDYAVTCPGQRATSIYGVAFTPDMRRMVYTCEHALFSYDFTSEPTQLEDFGLAGPFVELAFIGDSLVWGADFSETMVWDIDNGMIPLVYIQHGLPARINTYRTQVAVTSGTLNPMTIRDAYTLEPVREIDEPYGFVALSPDGRLLVIDHDTVTFRVYDTTTGNIAFELVHPGDVEIGSNVEDPAAFSPDGTRLATSTCVAYDPDDFRQCIQVDIVIWDVDDQSIAQRIPLTLSGESTYVFISRMAFSVDGRLLGVSVGNNSGNALHFYAMNGQQVGMPISACFDFWFTPDGTMILCDTGIESRFWGVAF